MSETAETTADRATDGLARTFRRFVDSVPDAFERVGANGLHLFKFAVPLAALNGVFVLGSDPDLTEVAVFAEEAAEFDLPWSIVTRTAPGRQILDIAARHGLTASSTTPLLARGLTNIEDVLVGVPAEATVRKVDGAHADVFADAAAAGFEMPKPIADVLTQPAMLEDPAVAAFVLEVGGVAVATGLNIVDGPDVGMYNGTARPQHRRRGYFRALVSARLRHAVANGAEFAFTQNTSMSRPLYESLGFRVVEDWTYLTKSHN
jgi:GNAT superfamily N-acetyltransferase